MRNKTNATKNAARTVDEEVEEVEDVPAIAKEIRRTEKINARENATRAAKTVEGNTKDEEETQAVDRIEEGDEEEEEELLRRKDDKKKAKDVAYTNATVQVQEKERMKREFEVASHKRDYDFVLLCMFINYRFSIYSLSLVINNDF